jgi:hypothetical protein
MRAVLRVQGDPGCAALDASSLGSPKFAGSREGTTAGRGVQAPAQVKGHFK